MFNECCWNMRTQLSQTIHTATGVLYKMVKVLAMVDLCKFGVSVWDTWFGIALSDRWAFDPADS